MIPPVHALPRPRNAIATRQAILASARWHFARENYENVGLREIAGDAGVDPALVSRYFGSKEQLFKEAVRDDDPMMKDIACADLPTHLTALLMDEDDEDSSGAAAKVKRLRMLLRSASSPKASQIIRETVDDDILRPLASVLEGEDAGIRASLCLAVLMSWGIMRSDVMTEVLNPAGRARLQRRLAALFTAVLKEVP